MLVLGRIHYSLFPGTFPGALVTLSVCEVKLNTKSPAPPKHHHHDNKWTGHGHGPGAPAGTVTTNSSMECGRGFSLLTFTVYEVYERFPSRNL